MDQAGELADCFVEPAGLDEEQVTAVVNEEGWILGMPEPRRR